MTVGEAIAQAKHLRHAAMNDDGTTYYRWLTQVEQEIVEHLNRHVDPDTLGLVWDGKNRHVCVRV